MKIIFGLSKLLKMLYFMPFHTFLVIIMSIRMFNLHPQWIQDFSSRSKKGQNKEVENKLIQKKFINISKTYLIN